MLDMTRSFATPLSLPFNPPAHIWIFLYALHPLFVAVAGGRRREVDVLIGNKRCAFLLFSFPSNIMRGALGGDKEDMLTLKADIFVFVCTGEASSSPLDEGLVFAVFFSSEENRRLS
jgi:hypothetical protein